MEAMWLLVKEAHTGWRRLLIVCATVTFCAVIIVRLKEARAIDFQSALSAAAIGWGAFAFAIFLLIGLRKIYLWVKTGFVSAESQPASPQASPVDHQASTYSKPDSEMIDASHASAIVGIVHLTNSKQDSEMIEASHNAGASKIDSDPFSYPLATRWPRFFARFFDLWWETLTIGLVVFILGTISGGYSSSFVDWVNRPGAGWLLAFFCTPIALILDALLYRLLGNTPGKAWLGLKVGSLDGESLSLAQYLKRNFSMWGGGLALGVPLINLLMMADQSARLGKGQQASYDESTGYRVYAKPVGWMRKSSFGLIFLGLFIIVAALSSLG